MSSWIIYVVYIFELFFYDPVLQSVSAHFFQFIIICAIFELSALRVPTDYYQLHTKVEIPTMLEKMPPPPPMMMKSKGPNNSMGSEQHLMKTIKDYMKKPSMMEMPQKIILLKMPSMKKMSQQMVMKMMKEQKMTMPNKKPAQSMNIPVKKKKPQVIMTSMHLPSMMKNNMPVMKTMPPKDIMPTMNSPHVMPKFMMKIPEPMMKMPQPMKKRPKPMMKMPKPMMKMPETMMKIPETMMKMPKPVLKMPQPMMKMPQPMKKMPKPIMKMPEPTIKMPKPLIKMPGAMMMDTGIPTMTDMAFPSEGHSLMTIKKDCPNSNKISVMYPELKAQSDLDPSFLGIDLPLPSSMSSLENMPKMPSEPLLSSSSLSDEPFKFSPALQLEESPSSMATDPYVRLPFSVYKKLLNSASKLFNNKPSISAVEMELSESEKNAPIINWKDVREKDGKYVVGDLDELEKSQLKISWNFD